MNKLIRIDFPDFAFDECMNHQLSPRTSDRLDKLTCKPLAERTRSSSEDDVVLTDDLMMAAENNENEPVISCSPPLRDHSPMKSSPRSVHSTHSNHSTPRSDRSTPRDVIII